MNATYKATLRHVPGLVAVLVLLSGLLLTVPLAGRAYGFAAAVVIAIFFLAWRFSKMQMVFTDESLIYCSWFRRYEISYSSINRVYRPADEGWPKDRMFGFSVFEIVAESCRTRINLLWFGPSGSRAFRARFLTRGNKNKGQQSQPG